MKTSHPQICAKYLVILWALSFYAIGLGADVIDRTVADSDARMNDDTSTALQESPSLAVSPYNFAVACWQDGRTAKARIYVQRAGQRGLFVQGNHLVNPFDANAEQRTPDIAINNLAHYVVVWEERGDSTNVYARIYGANAAALTAILKVNEQANSKTGSALPRVAMNSQGDFVVAWTNRRQDISGDIYAQRFRHDGQKIGANFLVHGNTIGAQTCPEVSMNANGRFVIVWEDGRNVHQPSQEYQIYAHVYRSTGESVGADFKVSGHPGGNVLPHFPAVAMQTDGKFFVCWSYGTVADIYGHLFDADANTLKNDYVLSALAAIEPVGACLAPRVSVNPGLGYAVIWHSDKGGGSDIYLKNFSTAGVQVGNHTILNDLAGNQTFGDVAISAKNLLIAVWKDDRNGNADIYGNWRGLRVPGNVVAAGGFDHRVPLSWDHIYGHDKTDRYKIWRSTGSGAPVTQIATVDLTARGAAGHALRDYIDFTAVNGQTYQYRIEAEDANSQGPSQWVTATASDTGHVLQSSWALKAPVIDGHMSAGEWNDATVVDIASPFAPLPVRLFVKNNASNIFVAVDEQNDEVIDPANLLAMVFDLDHNQKWDAGAPSKEGVLRIYNTAVGFSGIWGVYPDRLGTDANKNPTGLVKGISVASGHVQYEVSLDMTGTVKTKAGATLGMALWVDDPANHYFDHYGSAGEWPYGFIWEAAESQGDLVLATEAPPDTSTLPDAILVTNTHDAGPGTLRQAILDANAHSGKDLIHFNIPWTDPGYDATAGVWVIRTQLTQLIITDDETIIDGTTQKKYLGLNWPRPVIVVQGSDNISSGLTLTSSKNVLAEMTIAGFHSIQIRISGHQNHIYSCFLGTDFSGLRSGQLSGSGIVIEGGDGNEIGGVHMNQRNIIAGLPWDAIELSNGACRNIIRNNYIGVNKAGSDTLANGSGIYMHANCNANIIGPGNVIAGNHSQGILIADCDSNRVIGNCIGLDPTGKLNWGNAQAGITLQQGTSHTIIGGIVDVERNFICGNQAGIQIFDAGSDYNQIINNFIGVDNSGEVSLGNRNEGIAVYSGSHTLIGGENAMHGNLIGGNGRDGIMLSSAVMTTIAHNIIGANRDGTQNLPNLLNGILISHSVSEAQQNVIGPANLIAFNAEAGIKVMGSTANRITRNSVYGNIGGGILLSNGNQIMVSPQITALNPVRGVAPANAQVEIFGGRDAQGETYLATVTADAAGQFNWVGSTNGSYVTATATDALGNTSQFSPAFSTQTRYLVTNTNDNGPGSLRQVLLDTRDHAGADTIAFQIPITDAGYDSEKGVWIIRPNDGYGIDQDFILIDGHSQAAFMGSEPNPHGPEIAIDGINTSGVSGISLYGQGGKIRGLAVYNFQHMQMYVYGNDCEISGCHIGLDAMGQQRSQRSGNGIFVSNGQGAMIGGSKPTERNVISGLREVGIIIGTNASGVSVAGNYIGLSATGADTLTNKSYGISLSGLKNTIGPGNVISGNYTGIYIYGTQSDSNLVIGNFIGCDAAGSTTLGNAGHGIYFSEGASHNTVGGVSEAERNVIVANSSGIVFDGSNTHHNQALGNHIGTDVSGTQPWPNIYAGVEIFSGAHDQQIGPNNIIAHHQTRGIIIQHAASNNNTITRNQIYGQGEQGIWLMDHANADMPAPTLTGYPPLVGAAQPHAVVEIFSGPDDEGMYYEATVTADAAGQFTWSGAAIGPFITATATDVNGNTSEFSTALLTSVQDAYEQTPSQFALHANYPNPFNPVTTVVYDLPYPAMVHMMVFDVAGHCIRTLAVEEKPAGRHKAIWDGADDHGQRVASGVYFYRVNIRALDGDKTLFTAVKKMLLIK